jgi:hypothetical protein
LHFTILPRAEAGLDEMRLLHVETLTFQVFYPPNVPKYAIASHRWRADAEAMLADVVEKKDMTGYGFQKVKGFADYVRTHIPDLLWVWIDTCCIDQKSSSELTEAINSMFRWYRDAEVCLAYLQDIPAADDRCRIETSEWFLRGWTLQELLAPTIVVFLAKDWRVIGHKGKGNSGRQGTALESGVSLNHQIAHITQISEAILQDYDNSLGLSIEEKMKWMVGRQTTREEDLSYCLLGILDVRMTIRYGDGKDDTRDRLLKKAGKSKTAAPTIKPFSNVPFRRDPNFVERTQLTDQMRAKLLVPAGRAALVGLGGIG